MPWSKTPATYVRFALIALLVACVLAWLRYAPPSATWSPQRILGMRMQEPERVTQIEKVVVQGPERIKIIPKEKIKVIYRDLPTTATMEDNAAVITSVATIPPSPEGGWAMSVLRTGDDNVAVGSIEYKPKPIPFLKIKREMAIRAGFGTDGIIGEVAIRPLRLGPVEVEGRVYGRSGSGNSNSEVGAALLLEWKF